MTAIEWMDAGDLVAAFRDGHLSPVEVTDHLLDRIERYDHLLDAWCHLDPDTTRAQALASEQRWARGEPLGRLDGVPVAVKDVFVTEGWPTLRGSAVVDPAGPWLHDSPSVAALRRNGAVLLGKTTTPELGWKGVTDSPATGITRSPWDNALTPGGSSGGSSAALAAGMVPLALGTDGGGSIRIPAAMAGVAGIKPTWGRVPAWPASPYGGLAHAGPMARDVAGTALLLDVIAEPDHRDPGALMADGVDHHAAHGEGIAGRRVAFAPTLFGVEVDPGVATAVRAGVDALAAAGAEVDEVTLDLDDPVHAFEVLWNSGAAAATRHDTPDQRSRRDPGLQEICEDGARYSALDYLEAMATRAELAIAMGELHSRVDLLVTPALPIVAFGAGLEVPEGWPHRRWTSWTPFSYPFNLTQQPASSVPCGTSGGLPVGLQVVGARGADALVLQASRAVEAALPTERWPDLDALTPTP